VTKPLVSMFVHNLHGNPIVRAAPIAVALETLGCEVEILGFLPEGRDVYEPFRHRFNYRTLGAPASEMALWRRGRDLAMLARGSFLYAFKPLHATLWPAFLASRRSGNRRQFALDVEDDELHDFVPSPSGIYRRRHGLMAHWFRRYAVFTTVATRLLQRRYGGTIIRHATSDEKVFGIASGHHDAQCRREFGLPTQGTLVLFAGVPHRHKGLHELVAAMARPPCADLHLVLAGPVESEPFVAAKDLLGNRCHLLGMVENCRMSSLLAAIDIVPVLQHDTAIARAQLPAKAMEAMAAGRAVIGTAVGDLEELLGGPAGSERGWVASNASDAEGLSRLLSQIAIDSTGTRRRCQAAQAYATELAHPARIASQLRKLLPFSAGTPPDRSPGMSS
jgi:glycosyltransferase involved in cell wall biosynthesis